MQISRILLKYLLYLQIFEKKLKKNKICVDTFYLKLYIHFHRRTTERQTMFDRQREGKKDEIHEVRTTCSP